ncbi:hypothetical protein MTR_5g095610 [Medicago truncatula]|uniref:Uncharacterized protein n=1 Tax=Medicago truncatula TaxID=3880 RepID=G7K4P3_MEDTR|nr:hypothetical protein MTR_5g095610 [Medicago truncatula]
MSDEVRMWWKVVAGADMVVAQLILVMESNINVGEILEDTSKFRGTYSQVTRQKLHNIAVIGGSFVVV